MAFALPVSLTPTEEKADCFRLLSLVVDGGTLALRHRFDQLITPSDLQNTLNGTNTRGKLNALLNKRVLTNAQWNLLYPTTGRPCSDRFDVSLLYCLLKHICGLNEQSTSWNGVPPSFDTSVEADVNRLKQYRNDVSHLISISLNKGEFNRKWTKIEKVITRLGTGLPNLQQEIQNLKENSIDPEKEKIYQNEIAEWKKMDERLTGEIDTLKTEVHDNKETLEALKETVEDNKNCCYENSRNIQALEQKHQTHLKHVKHVEQKLQIVEETITTFSLQPRVQDSSVSETRNIPTTGNTASVTNFYIEDIERDDVYVTTQAHKMATEKFNLTGCLILSGLPGEGKTTMATKLISETTPIGFCRKLNCPADWKDVPLNNETPVTIFIDDIFGAGAVNERLLEDWSQILPDVDKAIKAKAVKAMITTRHYIFKEAKEKLKFLKILRDDNVQILSSCDLTDDERIEMLKNHLIHSKREYNADLIEECNREYERDSYLMGSTPSEFKAFRAMIGFPENVNLFVKNDHLYSQGSDFFSEPFLFFKKCIEEIFLDKEKSLALILVWTRPGKKLFIADVEPPNISKEIKETVAKFGFELGRITTETICMSLEYHKDGFLRFNSNDGTYTFSHNTVKDMVGLVVGKENKTLVLQFIESDIEFLRQFLTTDENKNDGLHIYMEPFRLKEVCKVVCKAIDAKEPTRDFALRDFIIYETFHDYAHHNPGPNELSVQKSILELDSFTNRCFVEIFCESNEGQFILSRPVEMMPQKCFNFGCDLDFGESFAIYLTTLALLYKSSLLIKRVLEQNLQCIHTTDFLKSTLMIASLLGLKGVLERLVQRGVIVDEDAIFLASANTSNESLEYLLQNFTGDCTECPHSINKNSPLIVAAKNDNREAVDCIKTLIRHGCSINYRNKNGWSALDKAVMYAAPESCKILLDNEANVNNKSAKFKRTLLHINADVGNARITSILLVHGLVVNVKDYRGHYPVQCAAFSDNIDIVDILLKADTSKVTQKHRVSYGKRSRIKGGSLYHIAVLNQSVKLIECLLQNNVCPNVRDFYGRTPLYVAVYGFEKKKEIRRLETYYEKKQYDVIKKLSEHSDAHIADHNGYTPLHAAVHKGKIEVVKLLAPLSDVNARDKYGKTPLHTACDKVDFEIFKVLIEDYRVDYRMRTKAGHSIFDILVRKTEWRNIRRRYQNHQRVTKYMKEYPRLRSFKEVFEKKDPTFLEEVTKDIVLSGHPKDILFTKFGYDPGEYFK